MWTVYADPAAGITEKMFEEAIDAKELVIPAKEGEKVIPMHTVLAAIAGQVSREEFAQIMFRRWRNRQIHCQHREVG